MNVASKELCQELYELSGWKADNYIQTVNRDMPSEYIRICKFEEDYDETLDDVGGDAYAYDLGYLLRKLPSSWTTGDISYSLDRQYQLALTDCGDGDWWCGYHDIGGMSPHEHTPIIDSSPENAACMLAIELFKQRVLTRRAGDA